MGIVFSSELTRFDDVVHSTHACKLNVIVKDLNFGNFIKVL